MTAFFARAFIAKAIVAAAACGLASAAQAQQAGTKSFSVDALTLAPTSVSPDVKAAVFNGDTTKEGVYSLYAVYAAGAKSTPHTHPDMRVVTVIRGTAYMATGETFKEADLKPYGVGEVVVIPANTPHYAWAKDGIVVFQETGYGPSATKLLP